MTRKLAELTQEQDARWGKLMELALGQGMTDEEAGENAWRGMCEEWPELAQFEGAK
jgi:hypothetical protein